MENLVTLKVGKAVIKCRPEDIGSIMSGLSALPTIDKKKTFEKSSVVHKNIKNIQAENAKDLVLKALANREGLHTVFSGLNEEIRDRFSEDPVTVTNSLIANGSITGRPIKGGFYIRKI